MTSTDTEGKSPGASASITAATTNASDASNQENNSPRGSSSKLSSKQQIRHRASVACASCRDRRIRCVVPKGQGECTQCKRTGIECIIKNDDERRRPISKAYTSSLSDRIALLEGMLKDQGVAPPPASYPPRTRQEAQAKQKEEEEQQKLQPQQPQQQQQQQQQQNPPLEHQSPGQVQQQTIEPRDLQSYSPYSADLEGHSSPGSARDFAIHELESMHNVGSMLSGGNFAHSQPWAKEPSPFRNLDPRKEDIVHRLLSTKGNLSFDQLSGRFRFFGPTANSHVYAESRDQFDSREPPEQVRRAERIIRSLTTPTYEYLMDCFWNYYNSTLQVIDREAFEADRDSQNPKFYSSFLHITILAGGYRFADREREDIRRITVGERESSLHRESKYMLDIELERPGGVPSVQALLILGDMECGVGRDNTGWMYSGMANRLAFDVGLHLDCRGDDIPEREVRIRHRVMRACILYDKYWALFLGRPTSIKSQDIGLDLLSKKFSQLSSAPQLPSEKSKTSKITDEEVHEQLVELMEVSGKIADTRDSQNNSSQASRDGISGGVINKNAGHSPGVFGAHESDENAYLHVISLDRQLQNWYRRLPKHMTWEPANIKTAPFSFFLLHQQYHVSMILLHRPWAKYGNIYSDGSSTGSHPSPEAPSPTIQGDVATQQHHITVTGQSLGLGDPQSIVDDSRTSLSRSICTQQAIRVARIFWQQRQRFDGRKICVRGIQHAGTSAIALIAALAYQTSESERRSYLGYLEILAAAMSDMSYTYQPAARMDDLLRAVLAQLRSDILGDNGLVSATRLGGVPNSAGTATWNGSPEGIYSVLPARRENPSDGNPETYQAFKKRRPTRSRSRRASEFARPRAAHHHSHNHHQARHGSGHPHSGSFGSLPGPHQQHRGNPPPLVTGIFDSSNHYGLDYLNGSAVDLDDPSGSYEGPGRGQDDYVLVTPSSETWGLDGFDGPRRNHHQQQQQQQQHPDGLDGTGADAGLLGSSLGSQAGGGAAGGMDWMGSEGGLNALSPVSLGGLVQNLDKAPGEGTADEQHGTGPGRNHELDFFSF